MILTRTYFLVTEHRKYTFEHLRGRLRGDLSLDDIKVIIYPFEENDPSMVPASYPVDDLKILKFLLAISCIKTNESLQFYD